MLMMRRQTTIERSVSYSGIGLHTGNKTTITFNPAPPDTGAVFIRTDLPDRPKIRADVAHVTDVARGTTIGINGVKVLTIEHVLAAFAGLGIDNIYCELDANEPPVGDGSAIPFVETLSQAGIVEQERPRKELKLLSPVIYENDGLVLIALPSDKFILTYMIEYNHPVLGTQFRSFTIEPTVFKEQIAPARTFCFLREVEQLKAHGLIKGGSLENAIVIGDEEILNDVLRFDDEFVRHKALDLLGDLVLLGSPLLAHVIAIKAGHAAHVEFVKQLREEAYADKKNSGEATGAAEMKGQCLNADQIQEIIPHRSPFLFVDRVTRLEEKTICGIKNVSISEPFFTGHVPGFSIMPGVLIIEAIGQLGAILVLKRMMKEKKLPVLLGIEKAKFRRPVHPGDQMEIVVKITNVHKKYGKLRGEVYVEGNLTTEAELTFAIPR
jgi:UDP-3-O-[3-hydroxymyristoyl] N-acetylglucosamine deacetylase/3-hydroxyacyl-[acyl-carrier-protein] dehydratase